MKNNPWIVIHANDLYLSREYRMASPFQRGVWFGALKRAVYEGIGPVIPDLGKSTQGQCVQWIGCTLREAKRENPLLRWDGDDLWIVVGYSDDERLKEIRRRESNTERKRRYRMKKFGLDEYAQRIADAQKPVQYTGPKGT